MGGIQKGENIPRAAIYFAVKEHSYARRHDLQTAAILNQASAVFQSKASLLILEDLGIWGESGR